MGEVGENPQFSEYTDSGHAEHFLAHCCSSSSHHWLQIPGCGSDGPAWLLG
jgi:hypothetical protein